MPLFEANLLLFALLFGNSYRDGFYTLVRCANLAMQKRGDDHLEEAHSLFKANLLFFALLTKMSYFKVL